MNGLLVCAGPSAQKNIGDYIQTVSQEQFWDHTDCYVEREKLHDFTCTEKCNVIMNGWFMFDPSQFPPSPIINPLFISFHISPERAQKILSKDSVQYLKEHEPIGARDIGTLELLKQKGIRTYFSACLTLTLGLQYKKKDNTGKICFVDPYYGIGKTNKELFLQLIKAIPLYIKHKEKIHNFADNFVNERGKNIKNPLLNRIVRNLCAAKFYDSYSPIFTDELIFQAEYITHSVSQSAFKGDDEKMSYAKYLIRKYASSPLVITSRIHCALPCLGIETPVIFINSSNLENGMRSTGRLGGLLELFNVIRYSNGKLVGQTEHILKTLSVGKIGLSTTISNSNKYVQYRDILIENVKVFIQNCNS